MTRRQTLRLDWRRGNIRELRARYEQACRVEPHGAHEWRTFDAGNRRIRLLIHKAATPSDKAIVYFHGGGWIVGSPLTHADISNSLAITTGLSVISVDYRLAPEFDAHAAIDDGLIVLKNALTGDGYRSVILCGDSAGGALALAVERNAGKIRANIRGAASFYGCFGLAANAALHVGPRLSDGLDAASVRRYWVATNKSLGPSPYSISSLARGEGCPIHLVIAGRDPLGPDSIALARGLKNKGRPVTVDIHPFASHSFLQSPRASQARQIAYRKIADWIGTLV
jgi:acetyl esterase